MKKVQFIDLGLIDYKQAWDYQTEKHKELVDRKMRNRDLAKEGLEEEAQRHFLIFCEHPPVYTLGKSGSTDHLLLNEEQLKEQGFQFYKINRGGDITYHGPGQIVGYPIFDLECFFYRCTQIRALSGGSGDPDPGTLWAGRHSRERIHRGLAGSGRLVT
jgi:lipoyl(octanoyl) transferase